MSGSVKLNLLSGGSKTISAPDSASDETITLPAGTKTLATVENFTSTGIDDNATSTAITIDTSENITMNGAGPQLTLGSNAVSTGSCVVEIGRNRTGNGNAYVDLVGDATYTDYGLRIIRGNGGANTASEINHRGTGPLVINAREAGYLTFRTQNLERMRIDSSGRVTMPYQPAFRAHTFTPMSGIGTIVYTIAAHNIGSHYNTSTGKFTAPVAGVYHFDFSVLMAADSITSYVRVLFSLNGVSGETRAGDTLTGGSAGSFPNHEYRAVQMSHSFYLNANDTVEVKNDNSAGQTYQPSGLYGAFSGYLIG